MESVKKIKDAIDNMATVPKILNDILADSPDLEREHRDKLRISANILDFAVEMISMHLENFLKHLEQLTQQQQPINSGVSKQAKAKNFKCVE